MEYLKNNNNTISAKYKDEDVEFINENFEKIYGAIPEKLPSHRNFVITAVKRAAKYYDLQQEYYDLQEKVNQSQSQEPTADNNDALIKLQQQQQQLFEKLGASNFDEAIQIAEKPQEPQEPQETEKKQYSDEDVNSLLQLLNVETLNDAQNNINQLINDKPDVSGYETNIKEYEDSFQAMIDTLNKRDPELLEGIVNEYGEEIEPDQIVKYILDNQQKQAQEPKPEKTDNKNNINISEWPYLLALMYMESINEVKQSTVVNSVEDLIINHIFLKYFETGSLMRVSQSDVKKLKQAYENKEDWVLKKIENI